MAHFCPVGTNIFKNTRYGYYNIKEDPEGEKNES